MWIFIEFVITIITMPIFVKRTDWGWRACSIYMGCCMVFTSIIGIPVYKMTGG